MRTLGTFLSALLLTAALLLVLLAHVNAANGGLRYRRGYSVQNVFGHTWLCYGWSNGAYHCTTHWRRSGSTYQSLNTHWVPNVGAPRPAHSTPSSSYHASRSLSLRTVISQWSRTGYGAYTAWWGGDGYGMGQCTAGARFLSGNHIPTGLGNARDWAANAARRGMATGSVARVGATVVFSPGVQGASYLGHVGHVVGVYANGWFMMAAENDYFDGGGYNRVDYRYAHVGEGVRFIY